MSNRLLWGYGTEKRIILLHGPVGSAKSTIARLLKKGLEPILELMKVGCTPSNGHIPEDLRHVSGGEAIVPDPMNEDPIKLIPFDIRDQAIGDLKLGNDEYPIRVKGDLNPSSRYIFRLLMEHYHGDLKKVWSHCRIKRLLLSEQDRVGIGTFQPKDEKNQDSTELTGDINYRKDCRVWF